MVLAGNLETLEFGIQQFTFLIYSLVLEGGAYVILYLECSVSVQSTIYSVEGEWEYFFAHFRKGVKSFKKGSQDEVWVPRGPIY